MNSKGFSVVLLCLLAVFSCVGCAKKTPAQQAEKAFTKMFERDYPDWEISKIILTPCRGANMYRGCFDCTAKTYTYKCCMQKPDTSTFYGATVPCNQQHNSGETLTWSVIVTYAHGDCYYKLGKTASEYE